MLTKIETKYNVTLITLTGCEGCSIMLSNVVEAVSKSRKAIDFKHINIGNDTMNENKSFLSKHNIKDFPTLMLYIDKDLVFKYTGTMPVAVILRWIDIHFK